MGLFITPALSRQIRPDDTLQEFRLHLPQSLRDIVDLIADAADGVHHVLARHVPPVGPVLEIPWLKDVDAGRVLGMSPADAHG
jgi:hypothetical protein